MANKSLATAPADQTILVTGGAGFIGSHTCVELLEQGIGNRVVGMKDNKIYDVDIQEALSMKKPFEEELYKILNETAF